MIMVDRPDLRVVEDPESSRVCSICAEPATTRSAVDGASLCLNCFTETHWHPSWAKSYEDGK